MSTSSKSQTGSATPDGDPPSYDEHTQHTLCETGGYESTSSDGSTALTQPSGADRLADWLSTLASRGGRKGG